MKNSSRAIITKESIMRRLFAVLPVLALAAHPALAQAPAKAAPAPAAARQSAAAKKDLVEFEMMTWPEVKAAMAAGKTTALFYTGGTEQRGPQNVNGGHTLMGREIVRTIAQRLGNAIAMPVPAYTPNNASADLPGTIGLTPALPREARGRGRQNDPNAPPRKNNGITGDARRSTAALGKMAFDIKIDYAVKQIQGFLANQTKTTAQK